MIFPLLIHLLFCLCCVEDKSFTIYPHPYFLQSKRAYYATSNLLLPVDIHTVLDSHTVAVHSVLKIPINVAIHSVLDSHAVPISPL